MRARWSEKPVLLYKPIRHSWSSFRGTKLLRLIAVLVLGSAILNRLGPILVWTYYIERAEQAMEVGLSWPAPIALDSLPSANNREALVTAATYLDVAKRWRPGAALTYRLIGRISAAQRDWAKAAEAFEHARSLAPRNPMSTLESALIYEQMLLDTNQEQFAAFKPAERVREAWNTAGFDVNRFFARADEARIFQRHDEALAFYNRGLKLDPDRVEAWRHAGSLYKLKEAWAEALRCYSEANRLSPHDRDIWWELGAVYAGQRNWSAALDAYEQGLQAGSGTVGKSALYLQIGNIQQVSVTPPQLAEAWRAYEQALALDDYGSEMWGKAETYYQRGMVLIKQKRHTEALREYRQALVFNPKHYGANVTLASLLWYQGSREEAKALTRRAIDAYPDVPDAYRVLGDFYHEEGNRQGAILMYTRLLEIDSQDEVARKRLDELR